MGLNCMLDIRYRRKKMYKKYIFKHLACSVSFSVLWTAILSSRVFCPFYDTETRREDSQSLTVMLSILSFVVSFSLRWSVCTLYLQERITGLHFSFFLSFFIVFCFSTQTRVRRAAWRRRAAAARAADAPLLFVFVFFLLISFLFSSLWLLI